ncbi:anti-sigma factor [Demequina sp. NBRC 110053]|uniref:anti-sigma factor n=1 Tax=Demequina sp. NBRC 110053 TaxID=1570342 RepID=UPI000A0001D1|nr:anti-sigma factor [Demequina sp. NBRC 110053]
MIDNVHSLAAAYAVDALETADRDAFERHLPACDDCRAELEAFGAATAAMADAQATTPPAALRTEVLERIGRTAQLPPVVISAPTTDPIAVAATFGQPSGADARAGSDENVPAGAGENGPAGAGAGSGASADAGAGENGAAGAGAESGASAEAGSALGATSGAAAGSAARSAASAPADSAARSAAGSGDGPDSRSDSSSNASSDAHAARRSGSRWWPALVGAAATAAVFAVAWGLAGSGSESQSAVALEKDVMMIESAPDATSMDVDLGTGHLVMSERMDGYALMGSAAPMPDKGTEYQVWLILADGSKVAGPTFMPDEAGDYMTVVHTEDDVVAVAITCEPPGGSDEPTSDMVSMVEL